MSKIVVTGIGVLSTLGEGIEETRNTLLSGNTVISRGCFNDEHNLAQDYPFAIIAKTDAELIQQAEVNEKGTTRTDALANIAFNKAITDAQLSEAEIKSNRTAFLSASTVGGMYKTKELFLDATYNNAPSEYVSSYSASVHLMKIVKEYGITGPTTVINTACSSSANAIMMGAKLLKQKKVDIAIVGGVDCLSEFTFRGFNALGILSKDYCQPFDENRKGLNLGEAAGYIVMKREEDAANDSIHGAVKGWANVNDSFHSSALNEDGSGIMTCISKALEVAQLKASDIDFINTHGTGTVNNDLAEMTAISKIFAHNTPFYSSKSYTGHTLGAAGILETIFSLIGLSHNEVYPSKNIENPMTINKVYAANTELIRKPCQYALSNSFGFNGNCTSIILSAS